MTVQNKQIPDILRKVQSAEHDPKVHGEGYVIAWSPTKRKVVRPHAVIGYLGAKKLEYFFVKTQSSSLAVKKLQIEWSEGTTDVGLTFEANFQIRIASKDDAEDFVERMGKTTSPESGLFTLIEAKLGQCMHTVYANCKSRAANLLDYFYSGENHRGESDVLNEDVTRLVREALGGMDFRIGFTLQDAPVRVTDFKHCTEIAREPSGKRFSVESECTLRLNNYQIFQKSGIKKVEDVIRFMKSAIDMSVREHIIGKSLLELLSNFERNHSSNEPSISENVRAAVKAQAMAIGYELRSFYSLPDLAPLKLLSGIRIDIDGDEHAFSTGYGGGLVRISLSIDVRAKHGEFEKQKHLLSSATGGDAVDMLSMSFADVVEKIKVPVLRICANVFKQYSHRECIGEFDKTIRPALEKAIYDGMLHQFGLVVDIKSLFPVESEDASRFRELAARKWPFRFKVISKSAPPGSTLVEFQCAFRVIAIDMEHGWDTFEKTDFGYRMNSAARHTEEISAGSVADLDRKWKSLAIEKELKDIEEELVRFFKTGLELVPNLAAWYRDRTANQEVQRVMLEKAKLRLKTNRGLEFEIEHLTLDDEFVKRNLLRDREILAGQILDRAVMSGDQEKSRQVRDYQHETQVLGAITEAEISVIRDDEDLESLGAMKGELQRKAKSAARKPRTIEEMLPSVAGDTFVLEHTEGVFGSTQKVAGEGDHDS